MKLNPGETFEPFPPKRRASLSFLGVRYQSAVALWMSNTQQLTLHPSRNPLAHRRHPSRSMWFVPVAIQHLIPGMSSAHFFKRCCVPGAGHRGPGHHDEARLCGFVYPPPQRWRENAMPFGNGSGGLFVVKGSGDQRLPILVVRLACRKS